MNPVHRCALPPPYRIPPLAVQRERFSYSAAEVDHVIRWVSSNHRRQARVACWLAAGIGFVVGVSAVLVLK